MCVAPLRFDESDNRHVNFHSWMTFLRAMGERHQRENSWPLCDLEEFANAIPDFPTPFCCGWRNCLFQTNDMFTLYVHVALHTQLG